MNCFFIDNVVRVAFLCKHVRLSRVFYNILTNFFYLLTSLRDIVSQFTNTIADDNNDNDNERKFIQPVVINKSRTR